MKRTFTRDCGRFKKGESKEYPSSVWKNIAESLKSDLDEFSISDDTMIMQMLIKDDAKRGPGRPRLNY
mgnify:CR=1 FL=1